MPEIRAESFFRHLFIILSIYPLLTIASESWEGRWIPKDSNCRYEEEIAVYARNKIQFEDGSFKINNISKDGEWTKLSLVDPDFTPPKKQTWYVIARRNTLLVKDGNEITEFKRCK